MRGSPRGVGGTPLMGVWSPGRIGGGIPWGGPSSDGSLGEQCRGVPCPPGESAEPRGSRGCAAGREALRAAGRWQMPLTGQWVPMPGQWVPPGCRGTAGGAPRPLSLFPHPGRYLRLRPRGFLLPLPGGPALAAAAAPLLQHQPAPTAPGRLPLAPRPPPPALFSFNFHLHARLRPAGAGATPPPPPPRCRPALPAGRSQRRAGDRDGAPGRAGPGTGLRAPRPPGHPDLEKWRRCPSPAIPTPPSTSPIFLA